MLTSNRTYLDLIDFDANYWFKEEIDLQRIQISLLIVPKRLSLSLLSHKKINEIVKLYIVYIFSKKYQISATCRWHVIILKELFFFFFSFLISFSINLQLNLLLASRINTTCLDFWVQNYCNMKHSIYFWSI